ncbi:hypothetical protein WS76_07545 [Burkholderia humptydooensis]|nr:hypothetical protein WS76_07545 [Burkholderia humptydooensis]
MLERIDLGSEPDGKGGDTSRSAFNKLNADIDTIERTVPLDLAFLNDNADLTPAHVGKRFGLWMADAGKVIGFPPASSVRPNSCIHLFNAQEKVTIKLQAGDMSQITVLNTGDWVKYVSDGVKIWHVAARGRMMWDEVVGGKLTVGGDLIIARENDEAHLFVGKNDGYFYAGSGGAGWYSPKGGAFQYLLGDRTFRINGQKVFHEGNLSPVDAVSDQKIGGKKEFEVRPTFGAGVPWDSSNLPRPVSRFTGNNIRLGWRQTGNAWAIGVIVDETDNGNFVSSGGHGIKLDWTGAGVDVYVDGVRMGKMVIG